MPDNIMHLQYYVNTCVQIECNKNNKITFI